MCGGRGGGSLQYNGLPAPVSEAGPEPAGGVGVLATETPAETWGRASSSGLSQPVFLESPDEE